MSKINKTWDDYSSEELEEMWDFGDNSFDYRDEDSGRGPSFESETEDMPEQTRKGKMFTEDDGSAEEIDEEDASETSETDESDENDEWSNFDIDKAGEEQDDESEEEPEDEPEEDVEDEAEDELDEDEDTTDFYELKVLGETKRLSRDDPAIIPTLQKGFDYDRIKSKYEALKRFEGKEDLLDFLDELSVTAGEPIEDVIEDWRANRMVNKAKEEGKTLSKEEAKYQILKENIRKGKYSPKTPEPEPVFEEIKPVEPETPKEPIKTPEQLLKEKRNADIAEFKDEYPDVRPSTIPTEVWEDYKRGKRSLVACYEKYELKQLRAEAAKERDRAERNARSVGPKKKSGKATRSLKPEDDPMLYGWSAPKSYRNW